MIVIDRDERPVGASIRNFGHVCATGQSGELRELALGARERWLSAASRAGLDVRRDAGAVAARSHDEIDVLEEVAAARDSVELIDAAAVRAELGGAGGAALVGGARLTDDLRVDPRTAVPRLADWLGARGVEFSWRTSFLGVDDAGPGRVRVRTSRGIVTAAEVYVCVGHDLDRHFPDLADEAGVVRCSLQMMLTDDPGFRVAPAVLTATSLLRYAAFAETGAAAALRTRLTGERPDLLAADTNIMLTQRPDGGLLVGDSHTSDKTVDPFLDEGVSRLILTDVEDVLGTSLTVRQRWQGVYASRPGGPYLVGSPAPGVHVCAVTTGVGMTIGLELAARHVAGELVATVDSPT